MRLIYTLPLFFSINLANAEDINSNVNWSNISTTPEVNSQVIEKDFLPAKEETESSFIQDELTDFDFLTESIDERVFYNFKAKVRVLNRYTDEITDYDLKPQEILDLKKFKIEVKSCAIAPISNVDNQLAFVQVHRKGVLAFKGWMSNIHKTLNIPELPEIYLNLISCTKIEEK